MEIKITIQASDKLEAYKAVNKLCFETTVTEVETTDEIWVFEKNEDVKYFLNKNYRDAETGERVILK